MSISSLAQFLEGPGHLKDGNLVELSAHDHHADG
jgi:hypothetical protein